MILTISAYNELNTKKLMALYREGNEENARYFYPDAANPALALAKAEADFLEFLRTVFFTDTRNSYRVLEDNGVWISALRLTQVQERLYYVEALETRPEFRRKGYASALLSGVIDELKAAGPFRLCDCVLRGNIASLKTHEKCGFSIVSDPGYDYLAGDTNEKNYGLEYAYLSSSENNYFV